MRIVETLSNRFSLLYLRVWSVIVDGDDVQFDCCHCSSSCSICRLEFVWPSTNIYLQQVGFNMKEMRGRLQSNQHCKQRVIGRPTGATKINLIGPGSALEEREKHWENESNAFCVDVHHSVLQRLPSLVVVCVHWNELKETKCFISTNKCLSCGNSQCPSPWPARNNEESSKKYYSQKWHKLRPITRSRKQPKAANIIIIT